MWSCTNLKTVISVLTITLDRKKERKKKHKNKGYLGKEGGKTCERALNEFYTFPNPNIIEV